MISHLQEGPTFLLRLRMMRDGADVGSWACSDCDIRYHTDSSLQSPVLGKQKRRRRRNFLPGMCPPSPLPHCPLCLCIYSNCRRSLLKAQSIWAAFDSEMSNNSISVQTRTEINKEICLLYSPYYKESLFAICGDPRGE